MRLCDPFLIEIEFGNYARAKSKWNEFSDFITYFVRFESAKKVGFPIGWIVKRVEFNGKSSWVGRFDKNKSAESRADEITRSILKEPGEMVIRIVFYPLCQMEDVVVSFTQSSTFKASLNLTKVPCFIKRA